MIEELDGVIEFGESSFLGRLGFVCSLFDERTFRPIQGAQLGPRTTDAQLVQLMKLKQLEYLWLNETQVTDLSPLAGMQQLKAVYLGTDQEVFIPDSLGKVVQRF